MATKLYSYNNNSEGAGELATALGIKRIKHEGSQYRPRQGDTIINWGASNLPDLAPARILNRPCFVAAASNKLKFFELMDGSEDVRLPKWTTDRSEAYGWVVNDVEKRTVMVARTVLNGHSAQGLVLWSYQDALNGVECPRAPLYTLYTPKRAEYRIHVVGGRVIDIQKKIKRPDFVGEPNWKVRNHDNGFIYVRNDVVAPQDVLDNALACVARSGLDFGAVDVIWNDKQQQAYVLEINTGPGLTGQTVTNYVRAFKESFGI